MAEAFKKLYDTTLNQSHLNDGEQTLLSGGNNKVIKQISVTSPDIKLSNTFLELDGKNIGNINVDKGGTVNLEGHTIVPSSSTLKIKTTDWPIVAQKVVGICYDNTTDRLRYYYYIENGDGTAKDISHFSNSLQIQLQKEYETHYTSQSYAGDMIDMFMHYTPSSGQNIYWHGHDNNSVQVWYHGAAREAGNTTSNSSRNNSQFTYQNYKGFGLLDFRRNWLTNTNGSVADMKKFEMRNNGQFIHHSVNTYPTNYTIGGYATPKWGNTSTGHPSPYPTSSYPRAHVYHACYWYVPSSSNPQELYMKNLMNGSFHRFNFDASIQYADGDFVISVDHSSDTWYLYIYRSNTLIGQYKSTIPWSDLRDSTGDAATVNQQRKDHSHSWYTSRKDITVDQMPGDFHGAQMGFTPTGGFRTRTNQTNGPMITWDKDGNELYRYTEDPMFGRRTTSTSFAWRHFGVPIISSEAGSAGVNAADLKITITGIEQT